MKKVAGGMKLDLAAFRELEAFAQLGTELDPAAQRQLDRGYRMVELLKQKQYNPMATTDQVISIYAGTKGYFDKVPVDKVPEAEQELLRYMHDEKNEIWKQLDETKALSDELETQLKEALRHFSDWAARTYKTEEETA